MAKLLSLFTLQLLFGVFLPGLLQITSTDYLSVHPGENITLLCNITNSEISWYRLRSEEVKRLISAKQGKLKKSFLICYNVDESHFDITESSRSVSLVIIGVRETDLGFYYCGGQNDKKHIQFGKPIRLNFTDDHETGESSTPPDSQQSSGAELWITVCVCLVSVLINLICMCVFCCKIKGKSVSCSCCSNTTETTEKQETIHYASIQHKRKSRASAKKNSASDSDSVIYATVASQPRGP